jgi:hypothetical protein
MELRSLSPVFGGQESSGAETMGKMNWTRILLGGVVSALVMVLVRSTVLVFSAKKWRAAVQEAGGAAAASQGPGDVARGVLFMLAYGVFSVWLYAAIRPRFGSGPKTAVIAGFAVGLIGIALPSIGFASMGVLPASLSELFYVTAGLGLVYATLGTLAGAWLYKEE